MTRTVRVFGVFFILSAFIVFAAASGGGSEDAGAGASVETNEGANDNVDDTEANKEDEGEEEANGEELPSGGLSIQGSDTMVNLGQAFAERYMDEANSEASLAVTGGGSGTGIAALINDDVDIAQASRNMGEEEYEDAQANGVTAHEFVVGQDGLAVFIHPDNPKEEYTFAELKQIFTGEITNWSELGWEEGGDISVYSRQDNSGTYAFFNETVMDGADWAPGTHFMPGSSAIAEAVEQEANAIGYSGVGYLTDDLKAANVAFDEEGEYVTPLDAEKVDDGTYPIARPLMFYTNGTPEGVTLHYLNWVLKSDEAEQVLRETGFYAIGHYQEANQEVFSELGLDW